jgi:predicted small secreted protein
MKHTKTPSWIVGLLGIAAAATAAFIGGCNTLDGIGEDLSSAGRATRDAFSSDDDSRPASRYEGRSPTWP